MTAIVLIGILAAAVVGISIAFGGPILAAILGAVVLVGGLVWFVAMGGSETTPAEITRKAHDQEFLGPGGPDDPRA